MTNEKLLEIEVKLEGALKPQKLVKYWYKT